MTLSPQAPTAVPDGRHGVRPPRLVAHRGAPRVRRENTLPAVAVAEALGAETIDIDVRRTADGVAVLLHDETLGRMWGDARCVSTVDWCDVARLGNGLDRIPRLDDVLERLDGCRSTLLVDLADASDAMVAARTVAAFRGTTGVAWRGAPEAMSALRSVLPDADVWLAWESLEAPTAADLEELAPSTLDLDIAFLTPCTVEAAHDLGLQVSARTVDDDEPALWAARLGVDAVVTNDVASVRAAYAAVERDGWPDADREPGETEVASRAQALAHRIAHEVIAFTREHPVGSVTTKANPADLVTDVDRLVEQHVRSRVRTVFPSHGFTGEEYGAAPGDRHRWFLDPVDGTTNLANGVPWTSMSLCLTRGGRPLVGVVADPWRGEVLEARRGRGATLRDRPLRLDDAPRALAGAVVGTELDGHRPWAGFGAFLDALADRSCTLRVQGSGTLTIAQVAAGRGIGGCVSAFDPIDHGAAVLLVHEAGGVVLTRSGPVDGFPPVGEPFLVAHPGAADELHAVWTAALAAD
ncbi:myo-inositol-1(or 4)-monophosphatase/deoxyribonuclease-2 [Curtobacterium pusillum]|uniref:Myo-inositol-1(Or 4)-monophosphatase/deoxyribonuclease-2 n=1 Tax=Curtobacterium pusillum TaxID=69373 RepID=A0AAW3T7N8_9MICO|nr:inositol monophosphatase family protein [Curtobacterium pusillum]MBA8991331.1 myo-inositol-1(or 4)-monophosphatase/deoxyribonuclease-2 [Curtobacterium pusillum]